MLNGQPLELRGLARKSLLELGILLLRRLLIGEGGGLQLPALRLSLLPSFAEELLRLRRPHHLHRRRVDGPLLLCHRQVDGPLLLRHRRLDGPLRIQRHRVALVHRGPQLPFHRPEPFEGSRLGHLGLARGLLERPLKALGRVPRGLKLSLQVRELRLDHLSPHARLATGHLHRRELVVQRLDRPLCAGGRIAGELEGVALGLQHLLEVDEPLFLPRELGASLRRLGCERPLHLIQVGLEPTTLLCRGCELGDGCGLLLRQTRALALLPFRKGRLGERRRFAQRTHLSLTLPQLSLDLFAPRAGHTPLLLRRLALVAQLEHLLFDDGAPCLLHRERASQPARLLLLTAQRALARRELLTRTPRLVSHLGKLLLQLALGGARTLAQLVQLAPQLVSRAHRLGHLAVGHVMLYHTQLIREHVHVHPVGSALVAKVCVPPAAARVGHAVPARLLFLGGLEVRLEIGDHRTRGRAAACRLAEICHRGLRRGCVAQYRLACRASRRWRADAGRAVCATHVVERLAHRESAIVKRAAGAHGYRGCKTVTPKVCHT